MKPLTLTPHEVKLALKGELFQLIRLMEPQPENMDLFGVRDCNLDYQNEYYQKNILSRFKSPFGKPGDEFWVREEWVCYQTIDHVCYQWGASFSEVSDGMAGYKSDGHETIQDLKDHVRLMSGSEFEGIETEFEEWQPAPTMPQWASRLTLTHTGTEVKRVQDLTDEECILVGIDDDCDSDYTPDPNDESVEGCCFYHWGLKKLWQSQHPDYPWAENPWVFIGKFEGKKLSRHQST